MVIAGIELKCDRVEQAMRFCQWSGRGLAFLIIDIDRYKTINDGYGQAVGDELLRQFAKESGAFRVVDVDEVLGDCRLGVGRRFGACVRRARALIPREGGREAVAVVGGRGGERSSRLAVLLPPLVVLGADLGRILDVPALQLCAFRLPNLEFLEREHGLNAGDVIREAEYQGHHTPVVQIGTPEDLIRRADEALYVAKQNRGRGSIPAS